MEASERKGKIYGIVGTVIFHAVIIALLIMMKFNMSPTEKIDDGGGIFVMVGDMGESPDMQQEAPPIKQEIAEEAPQETVTQNIEQSITIEESKAEKRQREELAAAEKKKKAEAKEKSQIDNLVAGAFKGGGASKNTGGAPGSPNENSDTGASSGHAGYGSYDLGGRGLRKGEALPRPDYDNSNDEGSIAVVITVNPGGKVIQAQTTPIGSNGTAYSNRTLRSRAVESAQKALFEATSGKSNQQGTITYRFRQR